MVSINERLAEDVGKMLSLLYRGRSDVHGKFDLTTKSHKVVPGPLTQELYVQHVKGLQFVGPFYIRDDNSSCIFSFDIDINNFNYAKTLYNFTSTRYGWEPSISTSKGKGYHIDTFIGSKTPVKCSKLRALMHGVKRAVGFENLRIDEFPASNGVRKDGGVGNYCSMPLSGYFMNLGRTFYLDPKTGEPIKDIERSVLMAYNKSRVVESFIDEIILDIDKHGWLSLEDKANIPELFPKAAEQFISLMEEKKNKKQASSILLPPFTQEQNILVDELWGTMPLAMSEALFHQIEKRIYACDIPCVGHMFHGTREGHRDEACFRLAVHCKNTFELRKQEAKKILYDWNRRNIPPLDNHVISDKVDYVYDKNYSSFGCDRSPMKVFCHGICPLMTHERKSQEYNQILNNFPFKIDNKVYEILSDVNDIKSEKQFIEKKELQSEESPASLRDEPVFGALPFDTTIDPISIEPETSKSKTKSESINIPLEHLPPVPDLKQNIVIPPIGGAVPGESLTDHLLPGFSLDYLRRELIYTKDDISIHVTRIKETVSGFSATATLLYKGKLVTCDVLSLSKQASRIKFFKKLKSVISLDDNACDAMALMILQQLNASDAVVDFLTGGRGWKKTPPPPPPSSGDGGGNRDDNSGGGSGQGRSALPDISEDSRYIDPKTAKEAKSDVEYTLKSGIDYYKDTYFLFTRFPGNVQRVERDRKTGNQYIKIEEADVAVIITSNGDMFSIPPIPPEAKKDHIRKIRRLPPPYDKIQYPEVEPSWYLEQDLRWSLNSYLEFLEKKHIDKDWRPSYTAAQLVKEIENIFKRFVYFRNDEYYSVCALWCFLTYLFPNCKAFPFLFLHGERGTGKSTVCNIIHAICFNATYTVNTTEAAMFRFIELLRPTFIMDEREDLSSRHDMSQMTASTMQLLNSSYQNSDIKVPRVDTDLNRVRQYSTYGPKVIANIAGCESTILDRSIKINMVRADPSRKSRREDLSTEERAKPYWGELRDKIYTWVMSGGFREFRRVLEYGNYRNKMTLVDREREIWTPLYAMAELCASLGEPKFYSDVVSASTQSLIGKSMHGSDEIHHYVANAIQDIIEKGDPSEVQYFENGAKIQLYLYDITIGVSKYFGDPEEFIKKLGYRAVKKAMEVSGYTTNKTSFRDVRINKLVRDKDTGNLVKKEFKTKAIIMDTQIVKAIIDSKIGSIPRNNSEIINR